MNIRGDNHDVEEEELDEPIGPVSNAELWRRLRKLEKQIEKLPTNSDVRLLVIGGLVVSQMIPTLHLGPNPVSFALLALWGLIS